MGSLYLTWLAAELRGAGVPVVEYPGWETRSRSSGGYESGRPYCVMWHHTASGKNTSAQSDADYMCLNSDSRPIANLMIARNGEVWVLAAGATNTNGKGIATPFSRGTVPADSMNTYAVGIEICNDGLGELYSRAVIDHCFAASVTICRKLGLADTDCWMHHPYAPDRKIDPAQAWAVGQQAGTWHPASINNSGTWNVVELQAEHARRMNGGTTGGDEMTDADWQRMEALIDARLNAAFGVFGSDGTAKMSNQILHDHQNMTYNQTVVISRQIEDAGGSKAAVAAVDVQNQMLPVSPEA